ncbi:hypothetical protein L1987_33703 [Smallanthus sonchifolius]|uniref:Uncharacterized protein n=1 Tax=Smallanthus sonchifolius TaxID=185202 RepID=A0ACB9HR29_9ASTR|nr:hypothetical protein L1987_33703 [Smallanthus sonchifolius]
MDGSPSVTSVIATNIDLQQPQVTEPNQFEEDQYIPSMSKIRSSRSGSRAIVQPTEVYDNDDGGQTQALSIAAMAACRSSKVQLPDTSYSNEQAPSMGVMVGDRGDSQPGGGNFSYGAPPSHTDVARRDESQNGESGGGQYLSEENYEGMSLTGRDFARLYPTM